MMRIIFFILGILSVSFIAGCSEKRNEQAQQPVASLLTFHYDAARDVVLVHTQPLRYTAPLTADVYAQALTRLPDTSYAPSPNLQLSNPEVTIAGDVLTVNYRTAVGLDQLAAAQATAVMAAIEAWWWVPGIQQIRLLVNGEAITTLGPLAITQPLQRQYHTYVIQPRTEEVGYLVGALAPTSLTDAISILNRREVSEFPATQGFQPLLPPEVTMTVGSDRITNGILPVDLSTRIPGEATPRMAGLILEFTQFPQINAVQFTIGGAAVDEPFMRSNLNTPLSSQDLLLPTTVARVATEEMMQPITLAVQTYLGPETPVHVHDGLVWQEWAIAQVSREGGTQGQSVLLKQDAEGYKVISATEHLTADAVKTQELPEEMIVAFRLTGWEKYHLR